MKGKQQGLSYLRIVSLIAVGSFFVITFFRLIPVYLTDFSVGNSIQSLQSNPEYRAQIIRSSHPLVQIRRIMERQFVINDIRDVSLNKIQMEGVNDGVKVNLNYNKQLNFIGNVDFIIKFKHSVNVSRSDK